MAGRIGSDRFHLLLRSREMQAAVAGKIVVGNMLHLVRHGMGGCHIDASVSENHPYRPRVPGVSAEYLAGRSDESQPSSLGGNDAAGHILKIYTRYNPADGGDLETDTTELIPSQWLIGGHEFFGLRITGCEYAPRYYDGDLIIFERCGKTQQDRVELVSIGGDDAFLCHVVRKRTGKSFLPLDRRLEELYFSTEQLEQSDIQILGAAVQVRRME